MPTPTPIPTRQTGAAPQLLLMAYECNPNRGSEWAVGWGRVMQASREFEIHVITSAESHATVLTYAQQHPLPPHIHFYSPQEDRLLRLLRRIPRLFAYNYVAYRQWQRLAFRLARQLHAQHHFALSHQINVCTFREPGDTWKLGIPFLWGPVGGTQNFPRAFLAGLPPIEAFKEFMRSATNRFSLRKRRVRNAARTAAVLLAANSTNQRDYERVFQRPVDLLLETGLDRVQSPDRAKFEQPGALHLLWSGEFTTRKALPLLLQALASLQHDLDFELRILGKGPLEAEWKRIAAELGLAQRCHFLGHLPLSEAIAQLEWSHLFVFTSLRDTSGNVVLEALSYGVPVLCFDHQGVCDIVTSVGNIGVMACGIKIPVTEPKQAVADIAAAIRTLAADRALLLQLSFGATERAQHYLWSANGDRVNDLYRRLIAIPESV